LHRFNLGVTSEHAVRPLMRSGKIEGVADTAGRTRALDILQVNFDREV
jgi:hypothetical protein